MGFETFDHQSADPFYWEPSTWRAMNFRDMLCFHSWVFNRCSSELGRLDVGYTAHGWQSAPSFLPASSQKIYTNLVSVQLLYILPSMCRISHNYIQMSKSRWTGVKGWLSTCLTEYSCYSFFLFCFEACKHVSTVNKPLMRNWDGYRNFCNSHVHCLEYAVLPCL